MNIPTRTHRDPLNRAFSLPRLARAHYQADAVVFWTMTVFDRIRGWLNDSFHAQFRELMLHAAARDGLVCPIYCLMPDHIHFIWMGLRPDSDQLNAMAFLRTYLEPALTSAKFQPQAQDRVLRAEDRRRNAFAKICFYIAANPVRAGLISSEKSWRFTGTVVSGFPKLDPFVDDYWPKFWKVYSKLKGPNAGEIFRPRFEPAT